MLAEISHSSYLSLVSQWSVHIPAGYSWTLGWPGSCNCSPDSSAPPRGRLMVSHKQVPPSPALVGDPSWYLPMINTVIPDLLTTSTQGSLAQRNAPLTRGLVSVRGHGVSSPAPSLSFFAASPHLLSYSAPALFQEYNLDSSGSSFRETQWR